MRDERGVYNPRAIDRFIFALLGVVNLLNGLYLAGPWYLHVRPDGREAPLITLLQTDTAVVTFGTLLFVSGLALLYAASGRGATRVYTVITGYALLSAFLLRLYSLMGTIVILESWLPPNYVSQTASTIILGAYWVWVKVSVRPTK